MIIVTCAFMVVASVGTFVRVVLARFDTALPLGTIGANTVASFIAGLIAGSEGPTRVLVGVALCGSLSTFSTLVRHVHDQAQHHGRAQVAVTLALSLGPGVAAAAVGLELSS